MMMGLAQPKQLRGDQYVFHHYNLTKPGGGWQGVFWDCLGLGLQLGGQGGEVGHTGGFHGGRGAVAAGGDDF